MFTFGFYNSLNGDRRYDAIQMSSIFDGILVDGVFSNIGEMLATVPGTGRQVIVKTGRAWFNHTWNLNDTWMTLNIEPADTLRARIDSVVLEVDSNIEVRTNTIKIIKGTPAASPTPPTLINADGVYQYRLANVTVRASTSNILANDIAITVGTSETPFVTFPLKAMDVSDWFQQWNQDFEEWFTRLKEIMTDNVATKLQKEIEERVKIADKASMADVANGVANKWVDSSVLTASLPLGRVVKVFDTSDIWEVPDDILDNEITVFAIGGGGGGGGCNTSNSSNQYGGGGGGGGYIDYKVLKVSPRQVYTCTIGAGGVGGGQQINGTGGGTTIFELQGGFETILSVSGGEAGSYNGNGGNGGSGGGGGHGTSARNGGTGGKYGGGGGGNGAGSLKGTGGEFGGDGGDRSTTNSSASNGTPITAADALMFYPFVPAGPNSSGGTGGIRDGRSNGAGGGGGGYGSNGGNGGNWGRSYYATGLQCNGGGGGGGGYCGNGGNGGSGGGGGGGGLFAKGGNGGSGFSPPEAGDPGGAGGGGGFPYGGELGGRGGNGRIIIIYTKRT